MIEWRWGLKPLTPRDAHARNLADGARLRATPNLDSPTYAVPPFVPSGCAAATAEASRLGVRRVAGAREQTASTGWRPAPMRARRTAAAACLAARCSALGLAIAPWRRPRGLRRAPPRRRGPTARPPRPAYVPPVRHVFVINIENKGYDETWGAGPRRRTWRGRCGAKGVLLNSYYGTAHNSLPNYIAQISGQAPNPQMQADCQIFSTSWRPGHRQAPGQAVGAAASSPRRCPPCRGR